ncbi:thioredoxin family protein [Arthrobacter sp. MMS18-M83]|uniref:thioredoxin family protein n=1 Tax=Arthrobacter sp. MMS18-M83 TaxID=2996261 RepID=UPI00227AF16C|nr:thioredoxin family protein [Arthrobacter sp. MMS18-M83]WAH98146.1 thioredoxin family protein [Arthrobacter sp. MMS18-M83]
MEIELLHISDCPNTDEAARHLGAALTALGHGGAAIHRRLMESSEDTIGTAFAGSPTITIDGTDIFPDGAAANDLTCRLYRTPRGLVGVPTVDQIKEALRSHGL